MTTSLKLGFFIYEMERKLLDAANFKNNTTILKLLAIFFYKNANKII